jgi:hypothetical protein
MPLAQIAVAIIGALLSAGALFFAWRTWDRGRIVVVIEPLNWRLRRPGWEDPASGPEEVFLEARTRAIRGQAYVKSGAVVARRGEEPLSEFVPGQLSYGWTDAERWILFSVPLAKLKALDHDHGGIRSLAWRDPEGKIHETKFPALWLEQIRGRVPIEARQ